MSLSLCFRIRSSLSLFTKITNSGVGYQRQCISLFTEKPSESISSPKLHHLSHKLWPDLRPSLSPIEFHGRTRNTLAFTPTSIALSSLLSDFNITIPKEIPFPSTISNDFILPTCYDRLEKIDHAIHDPWEMPSQEGNYKKHAARLIVIRKRKMKKHKLQKLRKKMKFEWAKVRQRREMRKEKAFQAVLIAQIKEAEKFDAAQYVAEQLRKAHEIQIPQTWKGKRLPEFIIKEKLGIK